MSGQSRGAGLRERLEAGAVICAEGYLFELERRGYLQAGPYVPEAVLEHPEVVRQLHVEFARAGTDVIEAFTYYGHREKLKVIGKEEILEPLNRQALAIAREVADERGCLLAGNISNTNIYDPADETAKRLVRRAFEEQVAWAAEAGCDFIIGETFSYAGEAELALEVMRSSGLPTVVTFALHREPRTPDGYDMAEACGRLEQQGADVVGMNCIRGPVSMLPEIEKIRAAVSCHVAALPVPYRTTLENPGFHHFRDPGCACIPGERPFPTALDPFACNRYELGAFARTAFDLGVRYIGVCCGAGPHHIRSVAEALGRTPEASRYSPDMSRHSFFGADTTVKPGYKDLAARM